MDYYAGMDVSLELSSVCVVDANGKIVREDRVASEPAAHEFLRLKPDATEHLNPATGLLDVESMLMRESGKVRARITEDVAKARMAPIKTPIFVQGRDSDELQGIFRVCYDLLVELGKDRIYDSVHDAVTAATAGATATTPES